MRMITSVDVTRDHSMNPCGSGKQAAVTGQVVAVTHAAACLEMRVCSILLL